MADRIPHKAVLNVRHTSDDTAPLPCRSFYDVKNFDAPSILEDPDSSALPPQLWEEGGMGVFLHVLRLRQLGMSVPRAWCDVGSDLHTHRHGLLLAAHYLRNERRAFDTSRYSAGAESAEAKATALLEAAADSTAWARVMHAGGFGDDERQDVPHDVGLLRNAAACARLERCAAAEAADGAEGGTRLDAAVRRVVAALTGPEAQQVRLGCVDAYFTKRKEAFSGGAAFVAAERFVGRKEGYCFGAFPSSVVHFAMWPRMMIMNSVHR